MPRPKTQTPKVNLTTSVPIDLMLAVDAAATALDMNRSKFIELALSEKLVKPEGTSEVESA